MNKTGGSEEELYKQKYLKYKNKYILLKKYNLLGGACSCKLIGYLPPKGSKQDTYYQQYAILRTMLHPAKFDNLKTMFEKIGLNLIKITHDGEEKKRAVGVVISSQDDDTSYYNFITKISFDVVVNKSNTLFPSYHINFYDQWNIFNGLSSSSSGHLNMDLWRDD